MTNRIPERFRRLTGEHAARQIGDGAGHHDRDLFAARLFQFGDGVERGLGVQRVEDGLDQQDVDAAFEQGRRLFGIGDLEIVERDRAEARIVDVGRQRRGAVGRPDRAGNEARAAVALLRANAASRTSCAETRFNSGTRPSMP